MNKKFIIILTSIIFFFTLVGAGVYFYFTAKISSLQSTSTENSQNTSGPLLPTFNTSNEDGSSDTEDSFNTSGGTLSESLQNIDNNTSGEEILKDLKVNTIEDKAVSSYILTKIGTSTVQSLRYILKETGEIVEYDITNRTKTSLTTVEGGSVGESIWSQNGSYAAVRRSLEDGISTQLVRIASTTTISLEKNITSLAFFKNNNFIVYGVEKGDGYVVKVYDLKTLKAKELATLQMTEWLLDTTAENTIRATYKATAGQDGVSLNINPTTGAVKLDTRPLKGLAIKEIDSKKYYLLSTGSVGRNELLFGNKQTGDIFSLRENTFLEKCSYETLKTGVVCAVPKVLDDQKPYPDYWYQGRLISDDKLVYKHLSSTSTSLLYSFSGSPMSVINLSISPSGIFFQNSKTLGIYNLEN